MKEIKLLVTATNQSGELMTDKDREDLKEAFTRLSILYGIVVEVEDA